MLAQEIVLVDLCSCFSRFWVSFGQCTPSETVWLSPLPWAVRDLWAKKDLGKFTGTFSAKVPSHGVVMLRVTP